jgi:hypothetical protein
VANRTCSFIKAGGIRCKGAPINGSDLCAAHDGSTQEARRAGAKRGGKLGGRGRKNAEIGGLRGQLADLYAGVAAGKIPARTGAVLAQIANVQIRAASEERRVLFETGELVAAEEVLDLLKDLGDGVTRAGADYETRVRLWEAVEPIIDRFLENRDLSREPSRSRSP